MARLNNVLDELNGDDSERRVGVPRGRRGGPGALGPAGGPYEGFGEDDDSELFASDVGIDGGAASAEEAAMHVIDDED